MVDSTTAHSSTSKKTAAKATKAVKSSRKTSDTKKSDTVYYTSTYEDQLFDIVAGNNRYRPSWDESEKHPVWAVPNDKTEQFERHTHFQLGRVIRIK